MKTRLHKLFFGKTKWNFQKAELTEATEDLMNPARGWYQIYPFQAEEKPDLRSLSWCSANKDTLALVIIDIGAYRDGAIEEKALKNIRDILNFFSENQYDIILRIVYDHQGNALEREPFFFEQVREHLKQLTPLVKEFEKTIFVFQGMLIGNWGEMHTSRFLAPAKLKEMWNFLKQEAGEEIYFAVRKPVQWRILHPEGCGKIQLPYDNMGLFDDAIFGSENHLGTFGVEAKESAGWEGLWKREDELNFEEQLCLHVPNGGEAICGERYPLEGRAKDTVDTLKKMHITYLNRTYDEKILKLWKEWNWEEAGVWQNCKVYDYIGRHLGYRFWIKNVTIAPTEETGKLLLVSISVENVGFGNLYQEAELLLEWVDTVGEQYSQKIDYDMRALDSGMTQEISSEIEPTACRLYLSAKRKQDGRRIYFANKTGHGGRVPLGQICNGRKG